MLLSVICVGAVFPVVMLILKLLGSRLYIGIDRLRTICHLGNLLENDRIMNGVICILALRKRSVIFTQNTRDRHHIPA